MSGRQGSRRTSGKGTGDAERAAASRAPGRGLPAAEAAPRQVQIPGGPRVSTVGGTPRPKRMPTTFA